MGAGRGRRSSTEVGRTSASCSCRTLGPEDLSAAFLPDSPEDTGAVSPAGPAVTPVHSEIVSALGSPSKSLREGVAAGTLHAWT